MTKRIPTIILFAIIAIAFVSCAQEKDESDNSIQQRILDAYVAVNYPQGLQSTASGIKIINFEQGKGVKLENYNAALINYTSKDLAGNVSSTTYKNVAQQIGSFAKTTHYGPSFFTIGYGSTIVGLEELLLTMNKGAKIEAIIPPWLSIYAYSAGGTQQSTSNIIYSISLEDVISDIVKYEVDSVSAYANRVYPGLDSLSKGFYFKKFFNSSADTVAWGDAVNVRYVGKLLDGFVFDTNIADTAKKYGIYNSSNTYQALSVTFKKDLDEMKGGDGSSSLILGFCKALQKMKYEDTAISFFTSSYGYSASGKDKSIGPYSPIQFYLYIEPKATE